MVNRWRVEEDRFLEPARHHRRRRVHRRDREAAPRRRWAVGALGAAVAGRRAAGRRQSPRLARRSTRRRRCGSSPPTPPPAPRCASPKQDRGGTTPPSQHRPRGTANGPQRHGGARRALARAGRSRARRRRTGCASGCKPTPANSCAPKGSRSPARPCCAAPTNSCNNTSATRRSRYEQRTHRGIARLEHAATAGVLLLAAGSFVLSYDALHQLAVANHVPRPLAWIWPLIVDGFIITASLAVLHAVLLERTSALPVAAAADVLHHVGRLQRAARTTDAGRTTGRRDPTPHARAVVRTAHAPTPRPTATTAEAHPAIEPQNARVRFPAEPVEKTGTSDAVATLGHSLLQRAREIHEQHRHDSKKLTGKTLGQILGVSDGYARRLLRRDRSDPRRQPRRRAGGQLRRVFTSTQILLRG